MYWTVAIMGYSIFSLSIGKWPLLVIPCSVCLLESGHYGWLHLRAIYWKVAIMGYCIFNLSIEKWLLSVYFIFNPSIGKWLLWFHLFLISRRETVIMTYSIFTFCKKKSGRYKLTPGNINSYKWTSENLFCWINLIWSSDWSLSLLGFLASINGKKYLLWCFLKYFPRPIQVTRIKKSIKSFLYFQIDQAFIFFTLNKDIREIINMSHTDIRDL